MKPIPKGFQNFYSLTMCNPLYVNLKTLLNDLWFIYAKDFETVRVELPFNGTRREMRLLEFSDLKEKRLYTLDDF